MASPTQTNLIAELGVHLIWWFAHFLVFGGLVLLIHETLVNTHLMPVIFHDWILDLLGAIIAPLSLFFVSISIYFEKRGRTPPAPISLYFSAPVMILLSAIFFGLLIFQNGLAARYIDGLSAIALGGALLRLTGVPINLTRLHRET